MTGRVHLPLPGTPVSGLDTPCLLVDLDALEANLRTMAEYARSNGISLRPHFKSHMSLAIARRQLASGAIGLCAAKVSEAEVLVQGGVTDVLLANQIVTEMKLRRLAALCRVADVKVMVDDAENVELLERMAKVSGVVFGVLVEIRVRSAGSTLAKGLTRNGTDDLDKAVRLARQVTTCAHLRLRGLMGYEGPHPHVTDREQRNAVVRRDIELLIEARRRFEADGLPVEIVSAGGTPTYRVTAAIRGITEIQPGSYALMTPGKRKLSPEFQCAMRMLSTVVGRPDTDIAVIDAGMKCIKLGRQDPAPTDPDVIPVDRPGGCRLTHLSEEHGRLELDTAEARALRPADQVMLIPTHAAPTLNMHTHLYAVRGGVLEEVWNVDARGCFQ